MNFLPFVQFSARTFSECKLLVFRILDEPGIEVKQTFIIVVLAVLKGYRYHIPCCLPTPRIMVN
jgi:hypothetical protein